MKGFDKMSILNRNKKEALPNEYDSKIKELRNIILTNETRLWRAIERLVRADKIKHSFIADTNFSKKADEDYDYLLKSFEIIIKDLTIAIKNYNKYLADNINHFEIYKNYCSEPDSEEAIYNEVKRYYLFVEKEGKY